MPFYTPLRYPGGKRKLANYFKLLVGKNDFLGGSYVEPFAGGAAVAVSLLLDGFIGDAWINDIDPGIFSFWTCVKESSEELCRRIQGASVSMDEWRRQREVQSAERPDCIDLAFSTLFLNRTNRSGIVRGGVIGGKEQNGAFKIDARFNRRELVARIERIAGKADRLRVTCMDARDLLKEIRSSASLASALLFLDPPYYLNRAKLYKDDYEAADHNGLAQDLRALNIPWILTYDNCLEIRRLYRGMRCVTYDLHYAAARRYQGAEVMVFSRGLKIPEVPTPVLVPDRDIRAIRRILEESPREFPQ